MRFACQSCGKAYNLPEEKIADKSNVKLKCRVCGAIVEVKRQGDVVAQILEEVDAKRTRVSEAPAPLTSMSADDGDDATHAIAVGDQILSESNSNPDAAAAALLGHVKSALGQQRGLVPLPPPPPTGFGSPPAFGAPPSFGASASSPFAGAPPAGLSGGASAPFGAAQGSFGSSSAAAPFASPPPFGVTPVPPPLAGSEPAFARSEPVAPPLPQSVSLPSSLSGGIGSPPPPLPGEGASLHNGSNGMNPRFADVVPLPDEPGLPGVPQPVTGTMSAMSGDMG